MEVSDGNKKIGNDNQVEFENVDDVFKKDKIVKDKISLRNKKTDTLKDNKKQNTELKEGKTINKSEKRKKDNFNKDKKKDKKKTSQIDSKNKKQDNYNKNVKEDNNRKTGRKENNEIVQIDDRSDPDLEKTILKLKIDRIIDNKEDKELESLAVESKKKKSKDKSKNNELYDYDRDNLYEDADIDNRKSLHRKNVLFLFSIIFIFLVLWMFIPNFSLNGDSEITIGYKDVYVEPGYKASIFFMDDSDNVVVSSKVVNGKVGKYQINYEYKFLFFNLKKNRLVNVIDNIEPEITGVEDTIKICPKGDISKLEYKAYDEYDGDLTDKVSLIDNGDKLVLGVSDKSGNLVEKIINVSRIDDEGPKINLSGNETMYVSLGTRYIEPGYKVYDNCDGDLSNKVSVSGSVGSSVGTYKLTYVVSDSSSNKSEITRTVIVRNTNLYNSGNASPGTIYLTFDDGPNSGTTDYILDVLRDEGVKATFFVTCNGPDYLIKRMHDEGHTVALHTATHNYGYIYSSVNNYFADLTRVSDRVKRITGIDSKIIRFPGGSSNTVSRQYKRGIMTDLTYQVLDKGYRYYDWNVDSMDAGGAGSSSQVYYNVINRLSHNRSNMVLMHDIKYTTRGAVRDIIRYGKSNGYKFEKITMDTYMIRHSVNN